jgi:formate-dependent nitrite reductase membrane component NrfD
VSERRDMTAAVGTPGGPASWRRAVKDAAVGLHQRGWQDSVWSSIYRRDSRYASADPPDPAQIEQANLRGRRGEPPAVIQGPIMHSPLWTWEVPLYFWLGGMAAGGSFVALACDLSGDHRSARVARKVALGGVLCSPPLLIADLGRPERFHHMLRIFKPRSPMSMGSWCLTVFGGLGSAAVGADVLGRPRTARALGAVNAVVGGYLGSYTGVLLASTAVPLWARSRLFLGPIFISTGTLTGAAVTRLALSATGMEPGHPTRVALGRVENGAMAAELLLSQVNHRRLGPLASVLGDGDGARWFRRAGWLARVGLASRLLRRHTRVAEHVASVCFLVAALCYRYGWVRSGRSSATDDEAVARMARERAPRAEPDVSLQVTHHR